MSIGPDPNAFAGNYTQIPLDANKLLIPYGDLGASSSYGRALVVPDDIPPTFSLVTLYGAKDGAHLWADSHLNGVGDVYVAGGAASAIGNQPARLTSIGGSTTFLDGSVALGGMSQGQQPIYGWHWSVAVDPGTLPASGGRLVQFTVRDDVHSRSVQLADVVLNPTVPAANEQVWLPFPMQLPSSLSASTLNFYVNGGGGLTGTGSLFLWVPST